MNLVLGVSRADVADYVQTLITVYVVLIFVRILLTWLPRIPYSRPLDAILTFVKDVTDPYLNLFRRFIPMVRIGPGGLDLSPMVAVIVLLIVGSFATAAIRG